MGIVVGLNLGRRGRLRGLIHGGNLYLDILPICRNGCLGRGNRLHKMVSNRLIVRSRSDFGLGGRLLTLRLGRLGSWLRSRSGLLSSRGWGSESRILHLDFGFLIIVIGHDSLVYQRFLRKV